MVDDNTGGDDRLVSSTQAAGEALIDLAQGPGVEAAAALEEAFDKTADAIERSLARAARSGEFSLTALSQSILQTLAKLAIERTVDSAFSAIFGAVSGGFGGARAAGGFVGAQGAYLVGETGPEVFTPASAGRVDPLTSSRGVTVNITVPSGTPGSDLRRSQGQIAAAVAQAVSRGQRNL